MANATSPSKKAAKSSSSSSSSSKTAAAASFAGKAANADIPIQGTSVPVIIKKDAWRKNALFCQVDDPKLSLLGDSGAVGRLKVTPDSLTVDIKGRQYTGTILSGPTVMLLNLAPPVGQKAGAFQETARAELVTNEFCHLEFSKDILGTITGEYAVSGSGTAGADGNESDANSSVASGVAVEGDAGSTEKKRNPVISNVMNKRRAKTAKLKKGVKRARKS